MSAMFLIGMMGGLTTIMSSLLEVLFLILDFFGIKRAVSSSKQGFNNIKKVIIGASIWKEQEPDGLIYGYWFLGYLKTEKETSGRVSTEITIIGSYNFLIKNGFLSNSVQEKNVEENTNKKNSIEVYDREGHYFRFRYDMSTLPFEFEPLENQQFAINFLAEQSIHSSNITALLYGRPGCGKSVIPLLLAKKMGAHYVDSFNPTTPGDTLSSLLSKFKLTPSKKIIIVLEEIDVLLSKVHNKEIIPHKDVCTLVSDKESWNSFLDKFDRKRVNNVILIMTSNKDPSFFDKMCPSYFRKGRLGHKILIE